MTNLKTRGITAIVFIGLVTTLVLQHSRQLTLREQNQALRQQADETPSGQRESIASSRPGGGNACLER
jgi:hypothetical protein